MKKNEDIEIVRGSGNAFRDLGLPDPEIKLAKAKIATRIIGILDDNQISVRKAEEMTGFAYSDFSAIRNANLKRFSLQRMIKILCALDQDAEVSIQIKQRSATAGSEARPAL